MRLQNKTIIVTGASSGIGESAAGLLAAEGANVVLGARREDLLKKNAERIREAGGRAVHLAGDVEEEDYARDLVRLAVSEFGGLDGAFNNAGTVGDMGPAVEMSIENWNSVVSTNLTSAFFAAKYQVPALKDGGGGSLVFTSSFVGHTIGFPGMGAYAAAKAGLVGLAQVLAVEHGAEGIRANALLPGGTKTAMAPQDADSQAFIKGLHALKRMAEPSEIAAAAVFLLSDEASFVTGTAMLADGGNSICKT